MKKLLLILLVAFISSCTEHEPSREVYVSKEIPKYTVTIGNGSRTNNYYVHSYVKEDNTYKLFNKQGVLTQELTITDGYYIEIELNE